MAERDVRVVIDRADGEVVQLSVSCVPLRDRSDEVTSVVLSLRDITEQIQEGERFAALSERLQEAHEIARLGSWELDSDSGLVTVFHPIPGSRLPVGATVDLGLLFKAIPVDDREAMKAAIAALATGEQPGAVQRRHAYERPDGQAWLETRARAVSRGDGRLVIRGSSQDVTEEELATQQLEESRAFLQATLDSLPSHIAVLDEAGEILMTNRAWDVFAERNGASSAATRANYLAVCDATPDDEAARTVAAGLRAILSGEESECAIEYPCHSPDEQRWFMFRAAAFAGAEIRPRCCCS